MSRRVAMRILLADPYREMVGGAQTYQKVLIASLRARGHAVALVHESPVDERSDVVDGRDPSEARFCVEELGLGRTREAIASWRPQVVYSQGLRSSLLEGDLIVRYPSALFAHNYYGTCATGTKLHMRPSPRPCERVFGPACIPINYAFGCGVRDPVALLRTYKSQSRHLHHVRSYRKVLVASRSMALEYERHGVPASRIERLPLLPPIAADSELPRVPAANGVVLFASRLTRLKGGLLLVDALALATRRLGRPLSLVVVGDGPERGSIEARASALGVPGRFLGWQDAVRVTTEMRDAELLAVPSLWPEPFGLVGIEAGGLGLPAVGFAVGGIPDWLRGGETGELAPGDAPSAAGLADAIVRALGDRSHYERLHEGAWRSARAYTLESHVQRLETILAEVAGLAA